MSLGLPADTRGMDTALAPKRQTQQTTTTPDSGLLIRKAAIVIGATYAVVVAGMLIAAPNLIGFTPLWFLLGVVMVGVVAAYVSGHVIEHRYSGRQSRRTQKFIASHRS